MDPNESNPEQPKKLSLAEEACKLVYLNFGQDASKLYQAGLKQKAEKEMLQSLEDSLGELVGPENAQNQMKHLWSQHKKTLG